MIVLVVGLGDGEGLGDTDGEGTTLGLGITLGDGKTEGNGLGMGEGDKLGLGFGVGDFLFQVAIFGDAQGANWHVVMHGRAVALALFEACFGASASRLPAF